MTRRKGVKPAGRRRHPGAARGADARRHHRRQDLGLARPRDAGHDARREPGDDRRLGGLVRKHGREVFYDAEHFFDGYKRNPDYALQHAAGRGGGGRMCSSCATPTAARCPADRPTSSRAGKRRSTSAARHPHAQRLRAGGGQYAGRRRRGRRLRSRARSTASASAAATPTSTHHPEPQAEDGARSAFPRIEPCTSCATCRASCPSWPTCKPWPSQPYVGDSAFAHKGGIHVVRRDSSTPRPTSTRIQQYAEAERQGTSGGRHQRQRSGSARSRCRGSGTRTGRSPTPARPRCRRRGADPPDLREDEPTQTAQCSQSVSISVGSSTAGRAAPKQVEQDGRFVGVGSASAAQGDRLVVRPRSDRVGPPAARSVRERPERGVTEGFEVEDRDHCDRRRDRRRGPGRPVVPPRSAHPRRRGIGRDRGGTLTTPSPSPSSAPGRPCRDRRRRGHAPDRAAQDQARWRRAQLRDARRWSLECVPATRSHGSDPERMPLGIGSSSGLLAGSTRCRGRVAGRSCRGLSRSMTIRGATARSGRWRSSRRPATCSATAWRMLAPPRAAARDDRRWPARAPASFDPRPSGTSDHPPGGRPSTPVGGPLEPPRRVRLRPHRVERIPFGPSGAIAPLPVLSPGRRTFVGRADDPLSIRRHRTIGRSALRAASARSTSLAVFPRSEDRFASRAATRSVSTASLRARPLRQKRGGAPGLRSGSDPGSSAPLGESSGRIPFAATLLGEPCHERFALHLGGLQLSLAAAAPWRSALRGEPPPARARDPLPGGARAPPDDAPHRAPAAARIPAPRECHRCLQPAAAQVEPPGPAAGEDGLRARPSWPPRRARAVRCRRPQCPRGLRRLLLDRDDRRSLRRIDRDEPRDQPGRRRHRLEGRPQQARSLRRVGVLRSRLVVHVRAKVDESDLAASRTGKPALASAADLERRLELAPSRTPTRPRSAARSRS